jgi:hypothetical protein
VLSRRSGRIIGLVTMLLLATAVAAMVGHAGTGYDLIVEIQPQESALAHDTSYLNSSQIVVFVALILVFVVRYVWRTAVASSSIQVRLMHGYGIYGARPDL